MEFNIKKMENEQLSAKTRQALVDLIRENTKDGRPFKLPSEEELAKGLGISRNVLRDALSCLEQAGCVTRRRSIGTMANPQIVNAKCRIDIEPDISQTIREAGYQSREEVLHVGYIEAKDEYFAEDETSYLDVQKVFYADDVPAIFCNDRIAGRAAHKAGDAVYRIKETHQYNFLIDHCDLAYLMAQINVSLADEKLSKILQVPLHEPLILIEDCGYNYDHAVVGHTLIYFKRDMLPIKFLRKSW